MDRKIKILVIDDEPDIRNIVRISLELDDFRVFTANNGREGIEKALQVQPDLILLDIMMPGMDGWMVYKNLKANPATSRIKIAMLTAKALREDMEKAERFKVSDYITKPFDPIGLPDLVRRILKNKE